MSPKNGLWRKDIKKISELSKRQGIIKNSNLSKLDKNLDIPVKGVSKTTGEQQKDADAFKQKLVAAMAEKLNPNIEKNKTKEESRDA